MFRAITLGRRTIAAFVGVSAVLVVTAGVSIVGPSMLPRAFASTCTITADSSTPAVATSFGNTSGTITSASFSPPAGSLVVAAVNVGFLSRNSATVTVKDSLGNTWSAGPGGNDGVYDFSGEWWHYYSSAPGSITVTATNSNHAQAGYQLGVRVLTGAASSQAASTGASFAQGSSTSSSVSHSFTTTTAGSKVFVAAAFGINGTGSAVSGTSTIADNGDSPENAEYLLGAGSSLTGTPGTSNFGWTDTKAGFFAWTAWEIMPATNCGTGSGPAVSSFTPTSGAAGTSVTITGTGFTGATAVTFNGAAATFTVNSDTQITATVPTAAATGPIAVTTPAGTGTSTASFTVTGTGSGPAVSSFTPTSGAAGTSVTITGTGFTGATAVTFNGAAATFTVNSDTQITATVPTAAATGPIAVTTPAGTGTSTASFTVTGTGSGPAVSSFTPTSGAAGTSVTITGTGFTGATAVTFNGAAATFTVNSDTQITATVPTAAATGPIAVTTPAGTGTSTASFTVTGQGGGGACTITADSSTPAVATSFGNTSGTITSASFSPPAGSLVVAAVNVGFLSRNSATVTVKDSLGNTWSAGPGGNDGVYDFSGEWWHYYSSAPGSITVTATNSNHAQAGYQLGVRVLTGAASSQAASTGASFAQGSSTSSSVSHSFTTTTAGSKVFVAAAFGINGTGSAVSGTSTIADNGDSPENAEYLLGAGSSLTGTPGTSNFGWTDTKAGFFAWTAWEIMPATNCGTGSGPAVSSFTPTSGAAGTSVTITGTGFTGATAVTFNGAAATFTVNSDTQITATVPTAAATGPIAVTTPAGTGTSTASFTVTGTGSGPAVSSFTPTSGAAGTSVTITGTGFTGATAVTFNGAAATFTVNSDTQITATVPTAAATGPIAVTTPAGTGTSTASFTVTGTGQTRKLVVIVEENEGFSDIVGNTSQAPYLNQLIANGKLFTNYSEAAIGSLFNYEAMTSGVTSAPSPNIFQAIDGSGGTLSWKEFMESMGGNCAAGTTANVPGTSDPLYTASHDPGYQNRSNTTCSTNDVPLTASTFNPASLPDFSYVVPNECNDMHTLPTNGQACPAYFGSNPGTSQINIGDNWLAAVVPSLLAQPNVTVLITWDEGGQPITTIEAGAGVTAGSTDGAAYNHYNLEAGLYSYFGLGTAPNNGATATPLPIPTRTP